jgi:hypothetical protein
LPAPYTLQKREKPVTKNRGLENQGSLPVRCHSHQSEMVTRCLDSGLHPNRSEYVAVMFSYGGLCILPKLDYGEDYISCLDLQLQPLVGVMVSVYDYTWKGFRTDLSYNAQEQLSTIYIDNMCGKVDLTVGVSSTFLQVAKTVNPSFHFGIKHKFFATHGQYMMQRSQTCLAFKGCKDVGFVVNFISRLTGEEGVEAQRPRFDMVSVTCAFNRPMSIAMGSLFDTMLRTIFPLSVNMNARSDEDTQQMHFKVTDWSPFLDIIREMNLIAVNDKLAPFDTVRLVLASVTSIGVNANSVFKVRFTWTQPFTCSDQSEINTFACLANALCIVLLSKVGVL